MPKTSASFIEPSPRLSSYRTTITSSSVTPLRVDHRRQTQNCNDRGSHPQRLKNKLHAVFVTTSGMERSTSRLFPSLRTIPSIPQYRTRYRFSPGHFFHDRRKDQI